VWVVPSGLQQLAGDLDPYAWQRQQSRCGGPNQRLKGLIGTIRSKLPLPRTLRVPSQACWKSEL